MKRFYLTNKAENDLLKIAKYTKREWGFEQRDLYIKQFDEVFHLIGETPDIGVACDYIRTGYRKVSQGRHIIFYRLAKNKKVEIVRILHKRMDVTGFSFNF